eukprot:7971906-Pyramimonas_sp.AAC.2
MQGSALLHAMLLGTKHSYITTALLLVFASSLYSATLPLTESLVLSTLGGKASKSLMSHPGGTTRRGDIKGMPPLPATV